MMNKAQILEQIEEEKAGLRKIAILFEDLEKIRKRTEERIKEWQELMKELPE